jgi:hypothetical protein
MGSACRKYTLLTGWAQLRLERVGGLKKDRPLAALSKWPKTWVFFQLF